MIDIYIIGAGGFAREVYFLIKQLEKYKVKAFVDINVGKYLNIDDKKIPIISEDNLEEIKASKNNCIAMGIGNPKLIKKTTTRFRDFYYPNLIHPSVIFNDNKILMGKGNVITSGVIFTTNIQMGDFNIFNLSSTVGHDVVIGNCNVINPLVNISGCVTIGDMNLLGVSSTILQNKEIGTNSIIGASSLVVKNVSNDVTVFGVPAKVFK